MNDKAAEGSPAAHAKAGSAASEPALPERWFLFSYKVPSEPSRARVGVWRELKRLGVCYIQQAVCVLPDRPGVRESLAKVRSRVEGYGGSCFAATLCELGESEVKQLVDGFISNSERDYAEILEECETKFVPEIVYERGRENYTFEEAEEIRQDLEKIRRWLARVEDRDWMNAPSRPIARQRVEDCQDLFDSFEDDVYARSSE